VSGEDPSGPPSRDDPRIRREPDGGAPSAPQPVEEPHTSIIRRHPTGPIPEPDDTRTGLIDRSAGDEAQTGYIRRATPVAIAPSAARPASPKTAVAAAATSIISGWATCVIATDLITGWWGSDPLFCVGIGFLTAVFAGGTIAGLILVLLRRSTGRWLIVVGSVIGLLVFASLFVAGAKVAWVVYAVPVLLFASILLALMPATKRWTRRT
jgi:hypothetical protein